MLNLRQDFEIPSDVIYFNASYMGPSPKRLRGVAETQLYAKEQPWILGSSAFFESTEKLRNLFGRLLSSSSDNIALIPAVSYGEETATLNLALKKGQNVIVPKGDFPSNYYPWLEYSRRQEAQLRLANREANQSWTEAILSSVDENTAVICVPHADWSDGRLFDVVKIGQLCRSRGIGFVVDCSQSLGAVPFPLQAADPDFLFCVGYKWLLAPYGVSYMYVADRHLQGRPLENNWINRKNSSDFSRLTDYQNEYLPGARRFDSGQHSQFVLNPLACEALSYLLEIGMENIFEHCRGLNNALAEGLSELGFQIPARGHRVGHLLGARPPDGIQARALRESLQKNKVYVSVRNEALRISPHLYNTSSDVDQFIEKIQRVLETSEQASTLSL